MSVMENRFLYHGSQYKLDIITPHQAMGENQAESQYAVYAAESMDEVIPFALPVRWYPDNPQGKRAFECEGGRLKLVYGSIDPDGVGYIYKVPADTFSKTDAWEWVSREPVRPLECREIRVKDYWDRIVFSEKAKEIMRELYGKNKTYITGR